MTLLTQDELTTTITCEELHTRTVVRARSRWLTASHWVELAVLAVLWGAVLMTASGAGLLLEAIIDTVRFGHPR